MRTPMILVALLMAVLSPAQAEDLTTFEDVPTPITTDTAREPFLSALPDGRLLMSWLAGTGDSRAVQMAVLTDETWSAPHTVAASPTIFANWADFASISAFRDGTLMAHWLQTSATSAYAYNLRMSLSPDEGATWSAPFTPHRDGTATQHGFATLMLAGDDMIAVWLDGRAYDERFADAPAALDMMQLRSAVISPDGSVTPDIALDFATCSCCQTDAAMSDDIALVVYRDRSPDEIRDISIIRRVGGHWSAPASVHDDLWELSGCPVNGPAIAARGPDVVVAWFTAAEDRPAVNIAFSADSGANFADAIRIDHGQPVGRVDAAMLEDGTALISWVKWDGPDELLMLCHATPDGCRASQRLAVNAAGGTINFPRMALTPDAIYIAWTQPRADGTDTIRMLRSIR